MALSPACGSTDGGGGGTAGASAAGAPGAAGATNTAGAGTGDPIKGKAVYTDSHIACGSCHADDATGREGPNITFSMTAGIGSWSYQQFHDAVQSSKDKDGTSLCMFMPPFPATLISESSMLDLHAYIKSLPIRDVVNEGTFVTGGSCPK